MIISNEHKFIILKNPKTAGTSLRKFDSFIEYSKFCNIVANDISVRFLFENVEQTADSLPFDLRMLPPSVMKLVIDGVLSTDSLTEKINYLAFAGFPIYGNFQYYIDLDKKIKKDFANDTELFFCNGDIEEYTPYVVMRDPIDRFKSIVRHVRSKSRKGLLIHLYRDQFKKVITESDKKILSTPPYMLDENIGFFDFSEPYRNLWNSFSFEDVAKKLIEGPIINPYDNLRINFLKIPQSYYCSDPRVKILKFSNIQNEIDDFCKKYKLPISILPRENSENHSDDEILSEETLNKVKQMYAEDIWIYNKLGN